MTTLEETALGYPLPHPDNNPRTVDVPRLRTALSMIDAHVVALHASRDTLATDKADKTQVAIDIATAVSQAISDLLDGAPAAYDTLVEIAAKLTGNDDVVAGILSSLATKAVASDVATALGFKADAAAMADALALKADKSTVAGQLAEKATPADVAVALQTVAPIGTVVQAMASPGANFLPLDGSKYLRSAYPGIAPMFAGMPHGMTQTAITPKSGESYPTERMLVTGGFIFMPRATPTMGLVRAPITTVSGGDDFVTVSTLSTAHQHYVAQANSGRIVHLSSPSSSSTPGSFRYSDDLGDTWSDEFPISGRSAFQLLGVAHLGNTMVFMTNGGLLRVEDNVIAATVVNQTATYSWSEVDGALVGTSANPGVVAARRYTVETGIVELNWRTIAPGAFGDRHFVMIDGDLAIVSSFLIANNISGPVGVVVHRISASGVMDQIGSFTLGSSHPAGLSSILILSAKTIKTGAGKDLLACVVRFPTGSGGYQTQFILYDFGTKTTAAIAGWSASVFTDGMSCDASGAVIGGTGQFRRFIFDTNPETEFRLPNQPNHFIKAVA